MAALKKISLPLPSGGRSAPLTLTRENSEWFCSRDELAKALSFGATSDEGSAGAQLVEIVSACKDVMAHPKASPSTSHLAHLALSIAIFEGIDHVPPELPLVEDYEDLASTGSYALSDEIFNNGVCATHIKLLEAYFTSPVNLQRDSIQLQADKSFSNIRDCIRRFLGFCRSHRGDEKVKSLGVLNLMHGPAVIGFIGWLLSSREVALPTCVQTMLCLEKIVQFACAELVPEMSDGPSYLSKFKCLGRQLQTWHQKCPRIRPDFEEQKKSGKFFELSDILEKTLAYCEAAIEAFEKAPSIDTAIGLRNSAMLAATAGDGMANVRPGQLACLTSELDRPCEKRGCIIPHCRGSSATVSPDGNCVFKFVHGKTSGTENGAVVIDCDKNTVTARVWRAYIQLAHPVLKEKSGNHLLMLSRDGEPIKDTAIATLVTRALAAAGLPSASSRTCRKACIVEAMRRVPKEEHEALARQMGNSMRAWKKSYDVEILSRQAKAAKVTYQGMVSGTVSGSGTASTPPAASQPPPPPPAPLALMGPSDPPHAAPMLVGASDPPTAPALAVASDPPSVPDPSPQSFAPMPRPPAPEVPASPACATPPESMPASLLSKRKRPTKLEELLAQRRDALAARAKAIADQRARILGISAMSVATEAPPQRLGGRPKRWVLKADAPEFLDLSEFDLLTMGDLNSLIPEYYDWAGELPYPTEANSGNRQWLRKMLCPM
jgi:hypothetical protein